MGLLPVLLQVMSLVTMCSWPVMVCTLLIQYAWIRCLEIYLALPWNCASAVAP